MNIKKQKIKKLRISKKEDKNRPVFYLDGKKTEEIKAGGILFYRLNKESTKYELLMINSRNNYEDFGGKTDIKDTSIIETVCREVEEESNGIFKAEILKETLKDIKPLYIKYCKYLLFFVELTEYYDPEIFGNQEIFEQIDRKVEWIEADNFTKKEFKNKLNFRLKFWPVLGKIKKINETVN